MLSGNLMRLSAIYWVSRLVAEKKLLNPFVQWSWQVGAAALFVFAERALCGSGTEDN